MVKHSILADVTQEDKTIHRFIEHARLKQIMDTKRPFPGKPMPPLSQFPPGHESPHHKALRPKLEATAAQR